AALAPLEDEEAAGGHGRRPGGDRLRQLRALARPAVGHDRYRHGPGDRPDQLEVEAGHGAFAVDAGEQDLPDAQLDQLLRPLDRVAAGVDLGAAGPDGGVLAVAADVERGHDGLA